MDFISTFNAIQRHLMIRKVQELERNSNRYRITAAPLSSSKTKELKWLTASNISDSHWTINSASTSIQWTFRTRVSKDYQPFVNSKDSISGPPPSLPTVVPKYCSIHPSLLLQLSVCFNMLSVTNLGQTHTHNQHCCQDNRSPHTHNLSERNCKAITHIANAIPQNIAQPLSHHFTVLASGRRYRSLRCRRTRFDKSLVLVAIADLNMGTR